MKKNEIWSRLLMRILLSGISGQVGGALLLRLRDHEVIAADRTTLDLNRPEEIDQTLNRIRPELIINPAAYTAVDKAEDEPAVAHGVNALAPATIARWAAARNVPFLHFSTDYVFDGSGERPWREDDPTNPVSVYGSSKLAGENAIREAGGYFLIVRTSWIYAARGLNFVRAIARRAAAEDELRVVADQIGAPTSAASIADIVSGLIGDDIDSVRERFARADGLLHLSAGGETSWHGFATAIVEGLRTRGVKLAVQHIHPIRTEEYPTKAKRPHNSRLDLSRLRDRFGITPAPWREALAPALDDLTRLLPVEGG